MPSVITVTLTITMIVTSYTDCDPGMKCDGITASGVKTWDGCVACGLRFEFGTVFEIPRLGRNFVCVDRGNLVGDNNLDIWMNNRDEALAFGVQILDVKVHGKMPSAKRTQRTRCPLWTSYTLWHKRQDDHYDHYTRYNMMDKMPIMTYHPICHDVKRVHSTLPPILGVSPASRIG